MELRDQIIPEFKVYNRYQELERREREKKELAWEKELLHAMNASDPLGQNVQVDAEETANTNRHSCSRSCPKLNVTHTNVQSRIENSPRLKKLRSCESATFKPGRDIKHSSSQLIQKFSSVESYPVNDDEEEHVEKKSSTNTNTVKVTERMSTTYTLCGICSKQAKNAAVVKSEVIGKKNDIGTCDIEGNLQQLEFIDRTPSPTDTRNDT